MAVGALARLTFMNSVRQPVTWLVVAIGGVLVLLSLVFGVFTFADEDRLRLLATAGVAVSALAGVFLAIVLASQTVHDELASRTAAMLFVKPVERWSFLVGKAIGVWTTVVLVISVIAALHCGAIGLGLAFSIEEFTGGDAHHHHHGHIERAQVTLPMASILPLLVAPRGPTNGDHDHDHDDDAATSTAEPAGHAEHGHASHPMLEVDWVPWRRVLLGHGLAAVQALTLTCLAAVLALRLGLVANLIIGFACFIAGHLVGAFGHVGVVVIPSLWLLNIDDSIQHQALDVPPGYFMLSLMYCALYSAGSLLVGSAWFERQDIP